MQFKKELLGEFIAIYEQSSPVIRQFEGCRSVRLVQDVQMPERLFTISEWESEHSLNEYRHSDFFNKTWQATKKLFDARPEAWSTRDI